MAATVVATTSALRRWRSISRIIRGRGTNSFTFECTTVNASHHRILVPVGSPPQAGPSTYTLTFERPGTFQYACLVHDELGMKGTIQVLATVPGLPRTGGAPLGVGLIIAAVGLALIGGGVVFRRRLTSAGLGLTQ